MQVLLLMAQRGIYNEGNKNLQRVCEKPDKIPYLISHGWR